MHPEPVSGRATEKVCICIQNQSAAGRPKKCAYASRISQRPGDPKVCIFIQNQSVAGRLKKCAYASRISQWPGDRKRVHMHPESVSGRATEKVCICIKNQ